MENTNDTDTAPEFSGSTESLPTGSATYCPEDNKLRLYVGRVPREEYLKLKAEGWQALHKQRETGGGDFAAIWTPERRDTALEYAGVIDDEDKGPAERAVERAERFEIYRDKRTAEAVGHADRFDAGPSAHGYQSQARAERSARRHDAIAGRAVDSWGKAEYWQSRTAGVISHALHVAAPGVRVGRIKEIEKDLRRISEGFQASAAALAAWSKPGLIHAEALEIAGGDGGGFTMARKEGDKKDFNQSPSAWDALTNHYPTLYAPRTLEEVIAAALRVFPRSIERQQDWIDHLSLRLAYENQMIEAQGGRAAFVEMEAGGWIGTRQIRKVTKSNASGRVVSVEVMGTFRGFTKESGHTREETKPCPVLVNVERLPADAYRAPTAEDKAALAATLKAEKAARPVKESCPLINPTEADALKLQAMLNKAERHARGEPSAPLKMSFATYSGRGAVVMICEDGTEHRSRYGQDITRCDVFKVRTVYGENYSARRVVVLTDKPQKAIPWAAMEKAKAAQPSPEKMLPRLAELAALVADVGGSYRQKTNEEQQFLSDAEYIGWLNLSCSRAAWTDAGAEVLKQYREAGVTAALSNAGESLA